MDQAPRNSLDNRAMGSHCPSAIEDQSAAACRPPEEREIVGDVRHDLNLRWAPVPGYEGLYEASNTGLVRALPRTVVHYKGGPSKRRARLMGQSLKFGYLRLSLTDASGKTRQMAVHRIVLAAFTGMQIENEFQCNHKNGDKADNNVANLEWCTASENVLHKYHVLGVPGSTRKGPVKVTFPDGREKVYLYAALAAADGFKAGAVYRVLLGFKKTHKGCRFERIEQYMGRAG